MIKDNQLIPTSAGQSKPQDEFADIPEFKQYDGKFPLLTPIYDRKYIVPFERLKTLMKNGECSARTNQLANIVVRELPSNYNAWEAKRRCLDAAQTTIAEELQFTEEVLEDTPKTFQGWEFRRYLIQLSKNPTGEVGLIEKLLEKDHKNYHIWTYRVWLCQTFNLFESEGKLIEGWIDKDVMNNTAWTYRHFLMQHTHPSDQQLSLELDYVFEKIRLSPDNQASWNYLRGWFPSIQLAKFPSKKGQAFTHDYKKHPKILDKVLGFVKDSPDLLQPYITLVHIYSNGEKEMAKGICELLAQRQKQKSTYWNWVAASL